MTESRDSTRIDVNGPAADDADERGGPDAAALRQLAEDLDEIYADVPATCCANSGECCALTPEEMDEGWATMFPLYRAEYARIADHVQRTFPAERAAELLSITEERPRQCPFLGPDKGCTIYPVRPLICRTYAVMNEQTIDAAAERHRDDLPAPWLRQFVRRESGMICPRVQVTQPEKVQRHAHNLITGAYERALERLSRRLELVSAARKEEIRPLIRRRSWPVRWSWGGYNALCRAPMTWVRQNLKSYWRKAMLNDLD